MKELFDKYYLRSPEERMQILKESGLIDELDYMTLDIQNADAMIENYIMNYQLPLGLALNFSIDNESYVIPMVIEEPSVVAAASNGAKILGNIETNIESKAAIGQVVLSEVNDIDLSKKLIEDNIEDLMAKVSSLTASMINRGGGPKKIWTDTFKDGDDEFLTVYFAIDTVDAMGANTMNTVLEAVSDDLEVLTSSKALLRIISNNATESIVKASVSVPLSKLNKDSKRAIEIAKRIELASKYANLDIYRASTHNKGIMNGIDAVVIATGNDWRAIEAACHTYASRSGRYKSLTEWTFLDDQEILKGKIEIPMPIATVGGTISVHPIAKWSLNLLGNPNSKTLATIIASVGLAQNFSAIRAIVTEGIQRGHMSLHAKSVALNAGANEKEINDVVKELKTKEKINLDEAKKILINLRKDI